ncbi:MAG: PQQ-dependent sugar dehydrogenase [Verrucomicrobia bacterium]|nr:PQQ-dependent sugar dehydrogenase [Verrucomicrobiota bacterium]
MRFCILFLTITSLVVFSFGCSRHAENSANETELPADEHFKVETLAEGFVDAMELAVTPDGRIFVVERTGGLHLYDPKTGETNLLAKIPVELRVEEFAREAGLLGITLDPKFSENGWLYLFFSEKGEAIQRLSRFRFTDGKLGDETTILEFPHNRKNAVCHEGGSLAFGPDGNLYLSTGDNTCPFESDGSAPIDEREGRHFYDAQRSAANTNDLRGKILRIKPNADGSYAIPEGNLFSPGTPKTRPEIFAMGCRNPFRISIDSHSGFVYWGEVGPDGATDTERGSSGYDEINQARKAGNFGWPYFVADNRAYADYDFSSEQIGARFNPDEPFNDSPNNTGLNQLPPTTEPLWAYPRASACAGPVYHYGDFPNNATKLPKVFDNSLIVFDWTSAWVRVLKLNDSGDVVSNKPWLGRHLFVHPIDMEFGNDGSLYVLEYGSLWYDGTDGRLRKITYSNEPIPIEVPETDPRMIGFDPEHPGSKLIANTTCLACHTTNMKSIGPAYFEVAEKYADDLNARDTLANKILTGGVGVWGAMPMPPHPQLNIEETQQMMDAILAVPPPPPEE